MVSAGDFRNGITLEIEGAVYQIIEFQHVKPGKGAAFVRTKIKNVMSGAVVERTFRPTEKFPAARIDKIEMQYLYADGDMYNFMNTETYDQVSLNADMVGDDRGPEHGGPVQEASAEGGAAHADRPGIKLRGEGIRVVYKLEKRDSQMLVIVVGVREDEEVYQIAHTRRVKHQL